MVGHEFEDGGFGAFFCCVEDVGKAASAELAGFLGEFVDFTASERGAVFYADSFDTRLLEDFEVGIFEYCGEVDEFHTVAKIGLVGAVSIDSEIIR